MMRKMFKVVRYQFALIAWVIAGTSAAHNDSWHSAAGPHGGTLERAGEYRLELCVSDAKVRVWVWDHFREGAPVDVRDARGVATTISTAGHVTIALVPEVGNLLIGAGGTAQAPFKEVTVSVALPGRSERFARFMDLKRSRGCRS